MYSNIKKHAIIAAVATIIAMTIMIVFSSSADAETMVCVVTKGQYVNVRTGATSSAASLGRKIHNGDVIDTVSVNHGWITISWNGVDAYVQAKYFEIADGRDYVVSANGRVRWREAPCGAIKGYYQPGDVVTVDAFRYGSDDELWARVGDRYINASFLEPYETDDEKEFYANDGRW